MIRKLRFLLPLVLGWALMGSQAQIPVVHALLFFSPTCPHCQMVIENVLPPLGDRYGDQFVVVLANIQTERGQALFQSAIDAFSIPPEQQAVPMLFVGDRYLLGSNQIPAELPDMIESGLATGGVGWPAIPGLIEALPDSVGTAPAHANTASFSNALAQDPLGYGLAGLVLFGLLATLGWFVWRRLRPTQRRIRGVSPKELGNLQSWLPPLLAAAGILVSFYMAYVETTGQTAVCGPLGDCNAVQQSEYAVLFGVLPVGVLGLVGYGLILALQLARRGQRSSLAVRMNQTLLALTVFGTLFSAYLTGLELFAIHAVCAWCLSSAVLMMVLLILTERGTAFQRVALPSRLSSS